MSSLDELDCAVDTIKTYGNKLSVLQCTTEYPVSPERLGLNLIESLAERYNVPTGLSDHSGTVYAGLAAAALGAEIYEAHAVFDKRMFGPDSTSSLDISEFKYLVDGIRYVNKATSSPMEKIDNDDSKRLKITFGRSLSINKDVSKGHLITEEDLESKKPYGKGISVDMYHSVIGRTLNTNKKKYDFLLERDIDC